MPYPFDQIFAADPDNTDMVAKNAPVVVFAPGDETKTPLKLTTLNGLPLENPITVNDRGFGPAFIADLDQVAWEGAELTGLLASYRGLKDDAEAARQAAEDIRAEVEAPTDEAVDRGIQRADISGQVHSVVTTEITTVAPQIVAPLVVQQVPPLVASAIKDDPTVAQSAATMAQSTVGLVPTFKPSTAFTAGQRVISPDGDVVTAKANFTSGATYNASQWEASAQAVRVGKLETRGVLPTGTDLNTLTSVADNGMYILSTSSIYTNLPAGLSGQSAILHVRNGGVGAGEQKIVRYGFNDTYWRNVRNYYSTPKTWQAWEKLGNAPIAIPTGANLDDYRTPGDYIVDNSTVASSLGGWPTQVPRGPMWLRVRATSGGIIFHEAQTYGATGTVLFRATESVNATPYPFQPWRTPITEVPPQVGLANTLRVDAWSQRQGGVKKTGGKGAVALRFDHGLNNFNSIIRPLLEARSIPYSLALNARNWGTAENDAVTAAAVNSWVAGGLCEVWNHGAHHNDASVYATQYESIVTGLTELRSLLPAADIDGFVIPGVGGTNYGGFNGGTSPDSFYNTSAGRLILEHHAVSTGAYPNTQHRVLDGRIRQGMGHFTMEARSFSEVVAEVDRAIQGKTGLQLMMHPSLLNTAGHMGTSTLVAILDYIGAKRDAGDVIVLSPYKLLLADAT